MNLKYAKCFRKCSTLFSKSVGPISYFEYISKLKKLQTVQLFEIKKVLIFLCWQKLSDHDYYSNKQYFTSHLLGVMFFIFEDE